MNSKIVAITIGDTKGIGLNILFKSIKENKIRKFILFCNYKIINKYIKKEKMNIEINLIKNNKKLDYKDKKLNIYSFNVNSLEDNTFKSLKYAYIFCKNKFCIGIITLPLRKDLIKRKIDKNFIGHTEYFQKLDKKKYSNMILVHKKIIISTITTHIPVNKISKIILNKEFLYNQINNLYKTLKIDFNIKKPRMIISGFNPHSGENGQIGLEEIKSIIPVIKKLKKGGLLIDGPSSPDSILIKKNLKKYNCFVFIYHDQALIPFKFISQFTGVNYTGNLDIIRTSPDHGTAYDIIKNKNISNESFINCYKLIKKIHKNRH